MLTKAEDYQYINPIKQGIKGEILPAVDGTAKAYVATYEDECYLVEMYLERMFWLMTYREDNLMWTDYTPDIVVCRREILKFLLERIRIDLPYGNIWYRGCPVPLNWEEPEYPVIGFGSTTDTTLWKNTMKLERDIKPSTDVPLLLDADTFRLLYYELYNTRRWALSIADLGILTEESFSLIDRSVFSRVNGVLARVQQGSYKVYSWIGDGDLTITEFKDKAHVPGMFFGESTSDFVIGYFSTIKYWIKAGFLINPRTRELYYSDVKFYPRVQLEIMYKENDRNVTIYRYAILSPIKFSFNVTNEEEGFDGYFSFSLTNPNHPIFLAGFRAAQEIMEREFLGAEIVQCGVYLNSVFLVTGEVKHNTDVPDTWDWEPRENSSKEEQALENV